MIPTFLRNHTSTIPFAHFSFFLFSAQTISGTITSHQSAGSKGEWPSTGWTAGRTPASSPSAGRPHGSASRWEEEWRLVQKFLHYRTFPPWLLGLLWKMHFLSCGGHSSKKNPLPPSPCPHCVLYPALMADTCSTFFAFLGPIWQMGNCSSTSQLASFIVFSARDHPWRTIA